MPTEYISRELFDERNDKYMALFKNDKEIIAMQTEMLNKHTISIERLILLEQRCETDREEVRKRMETMTETLTAISTSTADNTGRLNNHATRIKEIEDKPAKKMDAVILHVIKYIAIGVVGIIALYLTQRM